MTQSRETPLMVDLVDGEEVFETGVEMCAEDQEITEHLF